MEAKKREYSIVKERDGVKKPMEENPEEIITIVEKGKLYLAAYWVDDEGTITVLSILGHKSTQLGSMPPSTVAETLLREIIRDSQ